MGVGSGLGGQLGVSKEVTFGTYVAPTVFFEIESAKVKLDQIRAEGSGIAAGRLARRASQSVVVGRSGVATVQLARIPLTKFGIILQQLLGGTVAPVQQGATAAYLQTIPLVDNVGKFMTVQAGVPSAGGTVHPYSGLGGKVTKASFACRVDEILKGSLEVDLRDVTEAQTLAASSYPTESSAFSFKDMAVKVGTSVGTAAAIDGVTGFSLDVERRVKTNRRYANASGLKAEQITNDWPAVSGTIDADLITKADLADRYAGDTTFAVVWEFTGPQIVSPYNYKLTFELPAVKLRGETPGISGVDLVHEAFAFDAYGNDAGDPLVTCKYISTDTTV